MYKTGSLDINLDDTNRAEMLTQLVLRSAGVHALDEDGVFLRDHVSAAAASITPESAATAAYKLKLLIYLNY